MGSSRPLYDRHRFAAELIDHWVWLYFRFALSYRDIHEKMAARGVVVSYETVRHGAQKFGVIYAKLATFGVISCFLRPGGHLLVAARQFRHHPVSAGLDALGL